MAKKNEKDIFAKIVAHAWKDPRFKEKLLKNPKAALKEIGLDFPENMQLHVVEEKSNTITLVLPKPPSQTKELSEQELQKLAGGGWFDFARAVVKAGDFFDEVGRAAHNVFVNSTKAGANCSM